MVEVWIESALIACACIGLFLWLRMKNVELLELGESLDERLDEMQQGLEVVASVLGRLPELMPQFSINQSPIAQILEFLQGIRGEDSLTEPALRGSDGRFSDAPEEEEKP
jgi:hypothetical protein